MNRAPAVIALAFLCATATRSNVTLHPLFSDNAVLQRDVPLPVWGWGAPGEKVTIRLGGQTANAVADKAGTWRATLKPLPVTKTPLTLTATGRNTVTAGNILIGDVWLCGGQSNMEWGLGGCDAPDDIQSARFPLMRHFGVAMNFASTPQKTVQGAWLVTTPETAPGFTAVGFYFGRKVHTETGVPIGLLRSCVGGTNIECWMAQETLLNTPALKGYADHMRRSLKRYDAELQAAVPALEKWTSAAKAARKAGQPAPMPPDMPKFPFGEQAFDPRCVTLHNGMIAPLVPFPLKGAIWYQGESNAGSAADGEQYIEKNKAMLADWRRWFGNPNLPFYYVQLANWQAPNPDPAGGDGWAFMRDAQRKALAIPHTGMAVAIDIGDAADIHPRNKVDVGDRLARWALRNDYGQDVVASGPLYKGLKVESSKAIVSFDHIGNGLMVGEKRGRAPTVESANTPLRSFAIAGADRKWYWAEAVIQDDGTVACTSPNVPAPVAVRYAFSMNPNNANLYNRAGLPASPFRTDDW